MRNPVFVGADPWVVREAAKYYYRETGCESGENICVRVAVHLADLAAAPRTAQQRAASGWLFLLRLQPDNPLGPYQEAETGFVHVYGRGSVVSMQDQGSFWTIYHAIGRRDCKPAHSCRDVRMQPMFFNAEGRRCLDFHRSGGVTLLTRKPMRRGEPLRATRLKVLMRAAKQVSGMSTARCLGSTRRGSLEPDLSTAGSESAVGAPRRSGCRADAANTGSIACMTTRGIMPKL